MYQVELFSLFPTLPPSHLSNTDYGTPEVAMWQKLFHWSHQPLV